MNVLEVKNLRKSYRKGFFKTSVEVLKGVSFSVKEGSVTGFLGSNGAGKTTTMKCILEIAKKNSGEILFFGGQPLNSELKNRIGFLPERPYFYEYLTGEEFLRFYGQLSTNLTGKEISIRSETLLKRVKLDHAKTKPLRGYSKGMLQRIGMAQALIHNPDLVILDEPMAGLDPDGRQELSQMIKEISSDGASVFFSSHLLHDVETLCDQLVILKDGKVAYEGSTQSLLSGLQSGYKIKAANGNELLEEKVETIENLQNCIDRFRKEKINILEVINERPSLEEAFSQIVEGS
jgi:ABC-2 type transport system ATP-binding protein